MREKARLVFPHLAGVSNERVLKCSNRATYALASFASAVVAGPVVGCVDTLRPNAKGGRIGVARYQALIDSTDSEAVVVFAALALVALLGLSVGLAMACDDSRSA